MAPPAARPNFLQYTAGSCLLEIEVQPSALSQWSAKPIAKDLSFQLWLQDIDDVDGRTSGQGDADQERDDADGARRLIAEGDRTALQSITQYFQQRTAGVLAIAAINPRTHNTVAPSPPNSLLITEPLDYLQLCDITSVLSQYEQMMRTLPIALEPVLTTLPTPNVVREAPSESSNSESSNVIPLTEARRQRAGDTVRRQSSRRRLTRVWASSAAAALFAVGLTTTLLSRDPSLQETNVASDAVPESLEEDAAFEGSRPPSAESALEQEAVKDSNDATDNSSGATSESDVIARSNSQSAAPADVRPGAAVEPKPSSPRSPQSTAANPPRPLARAPVDNAPAADSDTDTAESAESPSLGVSGDPSNAESESAIAPSAPPPPPSAPPPPPSAPPPPPSAPSTASESEPESNVFGQPSPRTSQPSSRPSSVEPSPAVESAAPEEPIQAGDDAANRPTAQAPRRVERAAPESFSLPPSDQIPRSTSGGASRGRIFTPPTDADDAEARSDEALSSVVIAPGVAPTINRVQTYFQQRWQGSEPEALTYQLQINAMGEVISFIGLDTLSQESRDRLLPADMPPTFESSPSLEDNLVLRVQLKQDGTVEVTPL